MHISRIILAAVATASFTCAIHAQEVSPEGTVAEGAVSEAMPVRDMIDKFLAAKGWTEGENRKGNGNFFVAVGTGEIQAPLNHRNYIGSRVIAFDKAMLAAKAKMVEYLGLAISTEVEHTYSEGDIEPSLAKEEVPTDVSADSEESGTCMGKLRRLLQAKLDSALRKEGVDPDEKKNETARAEAARAARKILASEQYRRLSRTMAQHQVTGMQVCCSFESSKGGKGQIGVVAIWSPKLQAMAESMSYGGRLPSGVPKARIQDQIPQSATTLLSTFGVQQKTDENGNLVLISFGQAAAATDSLMSVDAAYEKARTSAMAGLRIFAGEAVTVARDTLQAESVEILEGNAKEYEDRSAFRQKASAVADTMGISGATVAKRWECEHPLAKRMVYGVVVAWSPEQAENARRLRNQMESVRVGGVGAGYATPPDYSGSFGNAGASADDDSF